MTLQSPSLRIGWIGVGRMGLAMGKLLLDGGCELSVYNRTTAKAEALVEFGATVVELPVDLASCDIVFTMVAGSDDLVTVTCGDSGLLTGATAPRVIVDGSTISASASSEVRSKAKEKGTELLAAPVSGNPKVVAAGKATIAVSGPPAAFELVRPYLEMMCRTATYVGEGDDARLVKIAHNLILGITAEALAETTVLMQKAGISRKAYLTFLNESVMGSMFTRYKSPGIIGLDWTPTFTPALLRKDLDLGLDAAAMLGVELPVVEVVRAEVQAMIDSGLTDLDFQALLLLRARAAGLDLLPEEGNVSDGLETNGSDRRAVEDVGKVG